jgi:hypothetical protein
VFQIYEKIHHNIGMSGSQEPTKTSTSSETGVSSEIEIYRDARIAEFLFSNAVDRADYESALSEVRRMGIYPESVAHGKPG